MDDGSVVSLASDMLSRCDSHGSVSRAFDELADRTPALRGAASSLKLTGSVDSDKNESLGNEFLSRFIGIVASGYADGADIKKPLAAFRDELERDIAARARFKAKVGGSAALIYMGMGVFFPLFSGISSIVLTTSLGAAGSGSAVLGTCFIAVSIVYAAMTLYLSAAFAHPERNAKANLFSTAPYIAMAAAVALLTKTYLSGVL
ncbi:MAG: hypothetical protein KGI04_03760 [Candidatus Micrarchaeota archaeon]|nr:hypothetical protein [Candidatus Micrarchaeota archaeon]